MARASACGRRRSFRPSRARPGQPLSSLLSGCSGRLESPWALRAREDRAFGAPTIDAGSARAIQGPGAIGEGNPCQRKHAHSPAEARALQRAARALQRKVVRGRSGNQLLASPYKELLKLRRARRPAEPRLARDGRVAPQSLDAPTQPRGARCDLTAPKDQPPKDQSPKDQPRNHSHGRRQTACHGGLRVERPA